jgi:RNA polymerase sigma-70 factor (ECF subfamily)
MPDATPFAEFIARIRAGDARAAEELVRKYEPLVRRAVRIRLEDRRLERLFDSMDVCQSVLKSFFVRTAAGQFDLEEPGQLVGLLVKMAGTKLAGAARRQHRHKRDQRRTSEGDEVLGGVAAGDPSPSRAVAAKDLLAAARDRLTDEERQLADLRAEGLTWAEVAARVGGTAQARRVQLGRALDRVARDLGLDDETDA